MVWLLLPKCTVISTKIKPWISRNEKFWNLRIERKEEGRANGMATARPLFNSDF